MENLDEHLLIAKIDMSCWKEQLKQAISSLQLINISDVISSISILKLGTWSQQSYFSSYPSFFQGFTETTLMPL